MLLAARRPDLVRGLLLLNATPFWAFRPAQGTEAAQGALWRALDGAVEGCVPVPEVGESVARHSRACAASTRVACQRRRRMPVPGLGE